LAYFDLSKYDLLHCNRSNPNCNGNNGLAHLTTRKCDFIGMFSVNGTRVEISKLVKTYMPRSQWTYGNLPPRATDVVKWHWGSPASKCQI